MPVIQDITASKLEHLKKILKHSDETIQNSFAQAHSVGELWSLLFKHRLFNLYSEIIAAGISPTPIEMNEIQHSNLVTAWYWLAIDNVSIPIFQDLLNKGILPNPQALSECNIDDNMNGWSYLAYNDEGISIFQYLLDKGILPDATALSICDRVDNCNSWWNLTASYVSIPIFQDLLNKGILPDAQALSACCTADNTNTWYRLAATNQGLSLFLDILNRDILPSTMALSIYNTKNNQNTWNLLNSNNEFATPIIKRLLSIQKLEIGYNLKLQHQVTTLLSREDMSFFYGFLYLFYLESKKMTFKIPIDIWLRIGTCLLPNSISKSLLSDENRSSFLKHYMVDSLSVYQSKFFNSSSKKRALTLRESIK